MISSVHNSADGDPSHVSQEALLQPVRDMGHSEILRGQFRGTQPFEKGLGFPHRVPELRAWDDVRLKGQVSILCFIRHSLVSICDIHAKRFLLKLAAHIWKGSLNFLQQHPELEQDVYFFVTKVELGYQNLYKQLKNSHFLLDFSMKAMKAKLNLKMIVLLGMMDFRADLHLCTHTPSMAQHGHGECSQI